MNITLEEAYKRREEAKKLGKWCPKMKGTYDDTFLLDTIIDFFKYGSQLLYPAKSYFVAIVYSKCMNKFFGIDFLDALDSPDLLPDDEYFVRYRDNSLFYDIILDVIGDVWQYSDSIKPTIDYFKAEYLLEDVDVQMSS